MQPKTPLFTSDSQHPPRFRHAVYLGGSSDKAYIFPIVGNPNRKKMHIFGFVGIFEYIC